jgi:hypothetical protein
VEWLDALQYGSFLHEVFARFMTKVRGQSGGKEAKVTVTDKNLLLDIFRQVAAECAATNPPNSLVHHELRLKALENDVIGFFQKELDNPNRPMYFELAFGMTDMEKREQTKSLTTAGNITLLDTTTLSVRGAIDRVDLRPDNRPMLIDYKSGKAKSPKPSLPFDGGKLIQAGLYSEIAGQIDPTLSNPLFRYYFSTQNGGYAEYTVDYQVHRKRFLSLLQALVDEMRKGNFVPSQNGIERSSFCSYCDFFNACARGKKQMLGTLEKGDDNLERIRKIEKEEVEKP